MYCLIVRVFPLTSYPFEALDNTRKLLIKKNGAMMYSHCAKDLLIMKEIQPNLIPSNTIPIGCVDLNPKIKFAICHWTWEIGYIWHLQRKSGCFAGMNTW